MKINNPNQKLVWNYAIKSKKLQDKSDFMKIVKFVKTSKFFSVASSDIQKIVRTNQILCKQVGCY